MKERANVTTVSGRVERDGSRGALAESAAPRLASAGAAVQRYEDLDGAEGRAVFFRPHRYAAADLAPVRGTVLLAAGDAERACALHDVSQNGVAFAWPRGQPVAVRQRLSLAVLFDAHQAFRGTGVVGSVREQHGTTLVGVSFDDFLLDVEEVLQLRSVQRWASEDVRPPPTRRAWSVAGCERYKALVAELRLFLDDARRELSDLEARLPWHVLHGKDNAARDALVTQLRADFVPEVIRLTEALDDAVRELPGGHGDPAAHEWSRRFLDEPLMQSPGCHRARHKPFGYPGDYEVMNFIYGQPFEGASLFARAVELAFWHSRSAQAVRARKDLVKQEVRALLAQPPPGDRPVRILSIAAGPAQEVFELLEELEDLPTALEIVLFEQDKNALAHAWRRIQPIAETRFPGLVRLTFLHDSIKRLLRDGDLFAPFGSFDLIYSAGLLDYLQARTAATLTRHLVGAARPGGRVLVANMVDHPARWYLEVLLDWPLVYRTQAELLEIGAAAAPGAALRILDEASGANPFLELIRP
jgi:extracellular factor (EF) 3-hydroxypalmitic acid methyl ester biosynthesis protein